MKRIARPDSLNAKAKPIPLPPSDEEEEVDDEEEMEEEEPKQVITKATVSAKPKALAQYIKNVDKDEDEEMDDDEEEEEEEEQKPEPKRKVVAKKVVAKVTPPSESDDDNDEEETQAPAADEDEQEEEEVVAEEDEEEDEEPKSTTTASKSSESATDLAVAARYKWLKEQMKNPIPVRPQMKNLQGHQFLWTYTSSDLKKNKFVFNGKTYTNPTMPYRKILEMEGIESKASSVKGWSDLEALVKRSIKAKEAEWTKLNKVLPSNIRSNRKKKDEESASTTASASAGAGADSKKKRKRDTAAAEPKKKQQPKKTSTAAPKAKQQKVAPKQQQKKKVEQEEEEEEPEEIVEEEAQEEEGEAEEQDESITPTGQPVKKLSTKRVMRYVQGVELLSVKPDIYWTALGYSLKYGVLRSIMNFNVDQLLKVIKPINAVAREAGQPLIQEPTNEQLASSHLLSAAQQLPQETIVQQEAVREQLEEDAFVRSDMVE